VAPVGTSVRMVGLFASIPVRLKQLHANVKKVNTQQPLDNMTDPS
jgi:DNA mismatch repair ATPase MutL